MDCRRAQRMLLHSDDPRPAHCADPDLAGHLRKCAACRRLAGQVVQVEEAWRNQPPPADAERARQAFLRKMARHPAAAARQAARTWRAVPVRWAAAAVLLIAAGMGALLLLSPARVEAAPDLLERLVDWNLQIAEAPDREERQRIHAERAAILGRALEEERLAPEERRLAAKLLETGGQLAHESDLFVQVDHLDAMSDALVEQLQIAADRGQDVRANLLAKQFHRVNERGLAPKLERVAVAGAGHPERQQRLDRLAERETRRLAKLENMLEKAPKGARKELRKAVEGAQKQQKNSRKGK